MGVTYGKEFSKRDLLKRLGNISQIASIKHFEYIDGKADSVRAFSVANGGGLDFTILESKSLDIFEMKFKGVNLNYISKPGLVAPGLADAKGVEFLRSITGGMMYTCGLNNVGTDCIDEGVYNGFHGRVRNIPAEKVSSTACWKGDDYILSVSGEMREASLLKDNLVLRRTITTKMGSKSISIRNEVENEGYEEQGLMVLFHINVGYPILDEGSRFVLPCLDVKSKDDIPAVDLEEWSKISGPIDQFTEQVFYHKVGSDKDGNTASAVINDSLGLGLYVKYNVLQLPRMTEWKSMMSGDYAFGIEPANCLVEGRVREKENGTLQKIAPFEKKAFDFEIGVLDGREDINRFDKYVEYLNESLNK